MSFEVFGGLHLSEIDQEINNKNYIEAHELLLKKIDFSKKQFKDSIAYLIPYVGRVALLKYPVKTATKEVQDFSQTILQEYSKNLDQKILVCLQLAEYYSWISNHQKAYEIYIQADDFSKQRSSMDYNERSKIQHNLSATALRMNIVELSSKHLDSAEIFIHQSKKPNSHTQYLISNSKGNLYYYAYQLDSASIYYNKAKHYILQSGKSSQQKLYSTAIVNNNLAGIYSLQAKSIEAIEVMKNTINNLETYINHKKEDDFKPEAPELLMEAMDNLAGIYKSIGDYHTALQLLQHSYQSKQKELPSTSSAHFKSEILLGQLYYAIKDYSIAKKYLQKGLDKIPTNSSNYYFWIADAYYTLALIEENNKKATSAESYFEKADSLYQIALDGYYDNIYLDMLNNKSLFLVNNNQLTKAIATIQKVIQYTIQQEGKISLQSYQNYTNLANIYFIGKQYDKAIEYSQQALDISKELMKSSSGTILDSVRIEQIQPKAYLLNAKSLYYSKLSPSKEFIESIIKKLSITKSIFQRRKQILVEDKDLGSAMEDYKEIIEFIKQLQLKLYQITKDNQYIHQIINLHEASIYYKIHNNIQKQESIRFLNVPDSIIDKEKVLQSQLSQTLNLEKSKTSSLNNYFKAETDWKSFQEMLQKKYPKYYHAKYNTDINWNSDEVLTQLNDSITIVRFIPIENDLFAYVIDKKNQHWIQLKSDSLNEKIKIIYDADLNNEDLYRFAHELYLEIWLPIEKYIANQRVTIIPEGNLYYLSFDMLSQKAAKNNQELIQYALLNKYAFSYHYSLFAFNSMSRNSKKLKGFVAFTPVFSDREKADYTQNLSVQNKNVDKEYLSLLPLPFSESLAQKVKRQFGGQVYARAASNTKNFTENAGNHSIIHIGTHAFSNDEYPEFTKLVFAKNGDTSNEENNIYLYEIYNQNLNSDISVLTACETGRPSFFPGNGMISMAHAFNYAGSKSILMGLWKIDEQSTTMIVDHFYNKLAEGLPKDIALQQAKIEYLNSARGRMLHPKYWAGLVIMGDVSPVQLSSPSNLLLYIVSIGILIVLLVNWYDNRSS